MEGFLLFCFAFFKFLLLITVLSLKQLVGEKRVRATMPEPRGPPGATGGPYFDGGLSIIRTDSMMGSQTHCYQCTVSADSQQHSYRQTLATNSVSMQLALCDLVVYMDGYDFC